MWEVLSITVMSCNFMKRNFALSVASNKQDKMTVLMLYCDSANDVTFRVKTDIYISQLAIKREGSGVNCIILFKPCSTTLYSGV